MEIYEFNILKLDERKAIVWEHGIFLINRIEGKIGLSLYKLFDFYAEVRLNNETNKIERVQTFKSIKPLEPYLDGINLNELN